jgi:hypothetical protein
MHWRKGQWGLWIVATAAQNGRQLGTKGSGKIEIPGGVPQGTTFNPKLNPRLKTVSCIYKQLQKLGSPWSSCKLL